MKKAFILLLFLVSFSINISNIPEVSLISRGTTRLDMTPTYSYFYMDAKKIFLLI